MVENVDLDAVLADIHTQASSFIGLGKVADYIPALARVSDQKFGIAIVACDGREASIGDAHERFSIQSISKVFTLMMAIRLRGLNLWHRVGREPSGNAFNSLVQLEAEHGIPRNPFINAGAHISTDCVVAGHSDPKQAILTEMRNLSGNPDLQFDAEVAASEAEHGNWNAAIANFLKAHNNLEGEVETVLDAYFHQCAIAMSCMDLARAGSFLANRGVDVASGRRIATPRKTKRINALMATCGLYDAVGSFAFHVGVPAKSGVGGGILAIVPGEMSVVVWSPGLDAKGNSFVGVKALEMLMTKIGKSIY